MFGAYKFSGRNPKIFELGGGGSAPVMSPSFIPDIAGAQSAANSAISTAQNNMGYANQDQALATQGQQGLLQGLTSQQNAVGTAQGYSNAAQGIYNQMSPYVQALQQGGQTFGNQMQGVSSNAANAAQQMYGTYNNTFAPVTTQAAMSSLGGYYLNPAKQAQLMNALQTGNTGAVNSLTNQAANGAAGLAMGQQQASSSNAAAQQARNLSRMGGDPNRMAAFSAELANQQSANAAGAANTARNNTYNQLTSQEGGMANTGLNYMNAAGQQGNVSSDAARTGTMAYQAAANAALPGAQMLAGAAQNLQGAQAGMGNYLSNGANSWYNMGANATGAQTGANNSVVNAYGNLANTDMGAAQNNVNALNAQTGAYTGQMNAVGGGLSGLGSLAGGLMGGGGGGGGGSSLSTLGSLAGGAADLMGGTGAWGSVGSGLVGLGAVAMGMF